MDECRDDKTAEMKKVTVYSPEMKLALIEEFLAAGGTISGSEFARSHGIPRNTFFGWMKKAGKPTSEVVGIKATAVAAQPVDVRPMIMTERGRMPFSQPGTEGLIPIVICGTEIRTSADGIVALVKALTSCSR